MNKFKFLCVFSMILFGVLFCAGDSWAATYYVDYDSGDDTKTGIQAQNKNTPWATWPGMRTKGGVTRGSYSHAAGDRFILKGGVTWPRTVTAITMAGSGTPGNHDYYGVDQTWYAGTSWSRPIISCGNDKCHPGSSDNLMFWIDQNYITLDNLELTGQRTYETDTGMPASINVDSAHDITLQNLYIHGWSHGPGVWEPYGVDFHIILGSTNPPYNGNVIVDNVLIDGSDTSQDMTGGIYAGANIVRNSTFRYIRSGVNTACISDFYNNEIGPLVAGLGSGTHSNAFQMQLCGQAFRFYNNYVHDSAVYAAMNLLLYPGSNYESDIYNNVMWNTGPSPIVIDGQFGHNETVKIYNNTIFSRSGVPCIREVSTLTTLIVQNNHCIQAQSSLISIEGSITNYINDHNLIQTPTVANGQGYVQANRYAPTDSNDSTVDAGTTINCSLCTNINKDILAVFRQQGFGWDIGAYEYSLGGLAPTATPTPAPTPTQTSAPTSTPTPTPSPTATPTSTPTTKQGDLNNDRLVDVIDLGILLSNWNSTSRPPADINQDGRTDVIDLGILLSNWG